MVTTLKEKVKTSGLTALLQDIERIEKVRERFGHIQTNWNEGFYYGVKKFIENLNGTMPNLKEDDMIIKNNWDKGYYSGIKRCVDSFNGTIPYLSKEDRKKYNKLRILLY